MISVFGGSHRISTENSPGRVSPVSKVLIELNSNISKPIEVNVTQKLEQTPDIEFTKRNILAYIEFPALKEKRPASNTAKLFHIKYRRHKTKLNFVGNFVLWKMVKRLGINVGGAQHEL